MLVTPGLGATIAGVVALAIVCPTSARINRILPAPLIALVLGTVLVLALFPMARHIPHAVLAGILIKVGLDIIDWQYLARIR